MSNEMINAEDVSVNQPDGVDLEVSSISELTNEGKNQDGSAIKSISHAGTHITRRR